MKETRVRAHACTPPVLVSPDSARHQSYLWNALGFPRTRCPWGFADQSDEPGPVHTCCAGHVGVRGNVRSGLIAEFGRTHRACDIPWRSLHNAARSAI